LHLKIVVSESLVWAIISSLITLGNAPTPLKIHIKGALNVGCSREEIIQIIIEMAAYAGFPAAINAIRVTREVFFELDKEKSVDHRNLSLQ
jgi:4-carboxymuconolactone decarboxylase